MAITEMKRLYLVGHDMQKALLLKELQKLGVIEPTDLKKDLGLKPELAELVSPASEPEVGKYDAMLANLQYGIDFLAPYQPRPGFVKGLLKSLIEGIFGAKFIVDKKEFEKIGSEIKKWLELCERVRELDTKLSRLRTEESKITVMMGQLESWKKLKLKIEELGETERTKALLGTVESKRFEQFVEELKELPEHWLEVVNILHGEHYFLLIYLKPREVVEELSRKYDIKRIAFPELKGTPSSILASWAEKLKKLELERKKVQKELTKLSKYRYELLVAYDYLAIEKNREAVVANFARTQSTFLLEGWIREQDIKKLEQALAKYKNIELIAREPFENEKPPIYLENKKIFQPFQVVTNLYGKPAYTEIDPTPFLAPFFILFFALCLTDAGYGLVLIALSLFALKKIHGGRSFFLLMIACGAMTVVTGALTGSFFGNLLGLRALWVNPIKDPMPFLLLALALGVVQTVYFGPLVKFYKTLKTKKVKDAILDNVPWVFFLIGALFLLLNELGFLGVTLRRVFRVESVFGLGFKDFGALLKPYVLIITIVSVVVVIATKGRKHKKIGRKLATGLASIYGISSYVGDVLSYSRLLALGMTTAAIALVVNTIALMCLSTPYVGIVLAIIILVVGHAFNIIINCLGAFVHTARLQFVEFFGKFLEGTGKSFSPFSESKKYTEVR